MAFWDIGVNISVSASTAINQINSIITTFDRLKAISASPLGNMLGPIAQQAGQAVTSINMLVGSLDKLRASSATPLGNFAQQLGQANQQVEVFSATVARLGTSAATAGNGFRALGPIISTVAGGPLNSLNNQLAQTSTGLNNLGNAGAGAVSKMGGLREMFTGNRGLVFGFSALFGTITGIVAEFQLYGDASSRVAAAQAQINALVASGQKGTGAYSQALQSLAKDQRFLDFSTRNLALAFTNLIPDTILIINGLLGITTKMQGLTTATQGLQTTLTGTQGVMSATAAAASSMTTATTVLTSAGTAATTEFTAMSGALSTMPVVLAETQGAEAALTLTSDGLTASNTLLAGEVIVARDAVGSVGPVMTTVRAEEGLLAAENEILGTSFATMGAKAEGGAAAAAAAGTKLGGIRGLFSGLLSGAGPLGMAGPIGLGVLAAGGFAVFLDQFSKFVTDTVSARIVAENENKKISESFAVMVNDLGASTATMADDLVNTTDAHTKMKDTIVSNNAAIAKSTTTTPIVPGQYNGPNVADQGNLLTPSIFKGGGGGPVEGLGFSNQAAGTGGQTGSYIQGYPDIPAMRSINNKAYADMLANTGASAWMKAQGPLTKPPLDMQGYLKLFMDSATQTGKIPIGPTSAKLLPDFQGSSVVGGLDADKMSKILEVQQRLTKARSDYAEENKKGVEADRQSLATSALKIKTLQEEGVNLLNTADTNRQAIEANKLYDDTVKKASDSLSQYNDFVGKMPIGLREATGMQQQYSTTVQTAEGVTTAYDAKLLEHLNTTRFLAAGYTNLNAVQNESIGVQEQVVEIGNGIVGGIEQQTNSIKAANIFWTQMNDTIKQDILSNQQMAISSVDVTQSLTNQTKAQYMTNTGILAGKQAARDYLDQTIMGVAQNKQYNTSLLEIANTMGIKIPQGMQLTSAQLEQVIFRFRETGSAAGVFADIINQRIAPAIQTLGGALTAKSWKEFKDAFGKLEFGDTPDKLVKKFEGLDNMVRKINEDAREMNTVFSEMDLAESLGKLDPKMFAQGLDAMAMQVEHIGKLQDIDVSNIVNFLDTVKATKDPTMLVKLHDVLALIEKDAENGYTSQELADINFQLKNIDVKSLEKFNGSLQTLLKITADIKKNKPGETFFGGNEDFFSTESKTKVDGKTVPKFTVYNVPKGPEPTSPEQKFSSAVDKFASAVGLFAGGKTPAIGANAGTTTGLTAGVSIGPDVKAIASTATSVISTFTSMAKSVTTIVTAMSKSVTTVINAMSVGIEKVTGAAAIAVNLEFKAMATGVISFTTTMAKSVTTVINAMGIGVEKVTGAMAIAVNLEFKAMATGAITFTAEMSKGVQTEIGNLYTVAVAVFTKMEEDVVSALQTMDKDGSAAVKSFAKTMDAELTKVAQAAGTAWQAVTDLGDAVDELDGKKATVTITTKFETSGSPPKSGGSKAGDKAANMLGDVIAASSPRTISSFQYGGAIETSHGPQIAVYGDNPGGKETVAFIPWDNPYPTLRKLSKLFRGNSSNESIDKAGGGGGDYVFNFEVHTHNIMDSREIGVSVTKQTFRKLRTRMG